MLIIGAILWVSLTLFFGGGGRGPYNRQSRGPHRRGDEVFPPILAAIVTAVLLLMGYCSAHRFG